MFVSYDTDARATYVELRSGEKIAATVEVSDVVMVDVDAAREPIGVEFLVLPESISPTMLNDLADRFEVFEALRDTNWLRIPA